MSKRVLLVYDVDGWAWHHMAMDLQRYAPDGYDVDVISWGLYIHDPPKILVTYDAILFFSWSGSLTHSPANRTCTYFATSAAQYNAIDEANWNTWIVTKSRNRQRAAERLPKYDGVLCSNHAVHGAVEKLTPHAYYTPAGVDDSLFRPGLDHSRRGPLRVGLCANPRGTHSVKGYHEVLLPLMDELRREGITWDVNDRDYRHALPRADMVDWYQGLDVFLCTSINEGTPMTVLEAAACGLPVVTTSVGTVRDWHDYKNTGLVVPRYHNPETARQTVRQMAELLRLFNRDRKRARDAGKLARRLVVDTYSWHHLAPVWLRAICGEN